MAGTTSPAKAIRRLFRLLKPDRKELTYVYWYSIMAGIVGLSVPIGVQSIIGIISAQTVSTSWVVLVLLILLGLALGGTLKIMQQSIIEVLQQKLFARAAFEFAYRLPRLKLNKIHEYYPPTLANRFFDILSVQKGMEKVVIDLATYSVQVLLSLILLAFYHPLFVVFGLLFVLLLVLLFRLTFSSGLQTSIKESSYKHEMAAWLHEVARHMGTFKLAGKDQVAMQQTDGLVGGYIHAREKHFTVLKTLYKGEVIFKILITASFLLLGTYLVVDKQLNIGQFVAAEIIVISLTTSVEKTAYNMASVYDTLTALEKIGYVTDLDIEPEDGIDLGEVHKGGLDVVVENLSYRFPGNLQNDLQEVTFSLPAGQALCISGFGGSGKTMLLDVLAGFYDDFNGQIMVGGVPLREIKPVSLRILLGDNLSQESFFGGTLWDNLCMGNAAITLDEVNVLAARLELNAYLNSLPSGLFTTLHPEGRGIPRHVASRLMLLRLLLKKPKLIVLDDFLAPVDEELRLRIARWIFDPANGYTILVSTNRKELAALCKQILVLNKGKVEHLGTYDGLSKEAWFNELFH